MNIKLDDNIKYKYPNIINKKLLYKEQKEKFK